jgi:hypothetical protein
MFWWKLYFVINCLLLALVTLIVVTVEPAIAEAAMVDKLSLIAGAISVVGLYSFIYKQMQLPRLFWGIGLAYLVMVSLAANIYIIILQYSDISTWELYLYIILVLFNLPTYYIFYKQLTK